MGVFRIDEQTFGDLRIFGNGGGDSLFQLFNRTSTRGGGIELEDWFRHPMTDANDINKRSDLIRFFCEADLAFAFTPELFERAELYLSDRDERSRLSPTEPGLQDRIAGLVSGDNGYKTVYNGVTALLELLQMLRELMESLKGTAAWPMLGVDISTLLQREELLGLPRAKQKGKLPYASVVELDTMLRYRYSRTTGSLLRQLYRIDALMTAAKVARDRGWTFARALPGDAGNLEIEGLFHPMLPGAVPNGLQLLPGSNVIFLTGANMAGKSTFMRSLGIALFLAQVGMPVPAKRMVFAVKDGLFTTINLPDNLGMGISHFYAEVLRIKKIASELNAGRNLMVIVDELFRGTNVKDAYEATVAVTGAFAGRYRSVFVISTHIIEAGVALGERHGNISFLYLPTIMKGGSPTYTYTLERGITEDRHGMVIIKNEGIPDLLKKGSADRSSGNSTPNTFGTDEQTLEDLNLLGKFRRDSTFNLFNRTRTRGGEQELERLFRQPIADVDLINSRVEQYRYFRDYGYAFPFEGEQLSQVEEYLGQGLKEGRLASAIRVLQRRLQAVLVRDNRYGAIVRGVRSVLIFLYQCRSFAAQFQDKKLPSLIEPAFEQFCRILEDSRLAIPPAIGDVEPAWQKLALMHHLFTVEVKGELEILCRVVYSFDVCLAVGETARENGFNFAQALPVDERRFEVSNLRHAAIRGAVGNSVTLDGGSNLLFLTGANMAGKSTLMKSVGVAVHLAHMGFPVAADHMVFSVKEGLFSSINVSDNMDLGLSHFYAEVLRVKQVAEAVGKGKALFVIFDELFKGTNVKDAFEATYSVTESFAGYRNCFFVISTHITEVGDLLKEHRDGLQYFYLPTVMEGARPRYTYRLKEGISTDRHGMLIIRQENILDTIDVAS